MSVFIGLALLAAVCGEKVYKFIDAAFQERTQRYAAVLAGDTDAEFLDFVAREIAALEHTPPADAGTYNGKPSARAVRCTSQELCDFGYYMKYHPSLGFRVYKIPLRGEALRDKALRDKALRDKCLEAERFYADLNDGLECN